MLTWSKLLATDDVLPSAESLGADRLNVVRLMGFRGYSASMILPA
jgi:hypothetical protein